MKRRVERKPKPGPSRRKKTVGIRRRNAARSREDILVQATSLFSQGGFAGTPINEIVKAAKINKRMVYHYFKDKTGLYREVFIRLWTELRDSVHRAMSENPGATAGELLFLFLHVTHRTMASRPEMVRLMMWEALEGGAISRSIWSEIRGPLFHDLRSLIERTKREGTLPPSLDASQAIISFLGILTFYFAYESSLGDMLGGAHPLSPNSIEKREAHVAQILRSLMV